MTIVQAIALGIVQGVTEFLPVSSSAHLILASRIVGWPDQGLLFDMAAHSGSLVAIMVYLRKEIVALGGAIPDLVGGRRTERARLLGQVVVATVPVVIAGVLLQDFVAGAGRSLLTLGVTSIVFGVLLYLADLRRHAAGREGPMRWSTAVQVGVAQAFAVIPGTSRSGVTMTAGLFAGMSRREAARFSFLLAIPVGLVVAVKDVWDFGRHGVEVVALPALAAGFLSAAVAAWLAIDWLLRWLRSRGFRGFAIYRVVLGAVLLVAALL